MTSKHHTSTQRARRRPGRPSTVASGEPVRQALLTAAREHFAARGFEAVGLREIAAVAGVNPAMVHYYFGSKQGLYLALLSEGAAPLLEGLERALAQSDAAAEQALREFLALFAATMQREPWLPQLFVREVLAPGGALREPFAERFAARGVKALNTLLARDRRRGRLARSLDTRLGAVAVMSLAWFPFIARPLIERVLGRPLDAKLAAALARQSADLLYPPAAARTRARR